MIAGRTSGTTQRSKRRTEGRRAAAEWPRASARRNGRRPNDDVWRSDTRIGMARPPFDRSARSHEPTRAGRALEPAGPEPFTQSEMMIVAAARELAGQHVCFVGVGLPNIAVNLAKRTIAPDLELVYEAGVFGARPARLPLSIGDPTIVTGATAVTSMFELFTFYLQGGLIDVGFLGAAQIDRFGNINTTVIGDYATPTTRLPGSGGACEIAINARQVFVIMRQSHPVVRRADRLPDEPGQPRRRRAERAHPTGAGLARSRPDGRRHRPRASTTSTTTARCASTRCIPGRRSSRRARRSAGRSESQKRSRRRRHPATTSCASSARSSIRAAPTRSSPPGRTIG